MNAYACVHIKCRLPCSKKAYASPRHTQSIHKGQQFPICTDCMLMTTTTCLKTHVQDFPASSTSLSVKRRRESRCTRVAVWRVTAHYLCFGVYLTCLLICDCIYNYLYISLLVCLSDYLFFSPLLSLSLPQTHFAFCNYPARQFHLILSLSRTRKVREGNQTYPPPIPLSFEWNLQMTLECLTINCR